MNFILVKRLIKFFFKKIRLLYYYLFYPKFQILNRHSNYEDYVKKQKEKTLDQIRIENGLVKSGV